MTQMDDAIIDAAETLADEDMTQLEAGSREDPVIDWYWTGLDKWDDMSLARLIDKAQVSEVSDRQISMARSAYLRRFKIRNDWRVN